MCFFESKSNGKITHVDGGIVRSSKPIGMRVAEKQRQMREEEKEREKETNKQTNRQSKNETDTSK